MSTVSIRRDPSIERPARRGLVWRVRQFASSVTCRADARVDAQLRELLASDAQWALLARLSPFDRAHHLRVHQVLWEWGHRDADLLRAALLHDVGKADGRQRANALHRTAHVLLRRFAPGSYARLSASPRRRPLGGLYLTRHHAHLGAELVRAAGASERTCELISRHEERSPVDDALLAALVAADEVAIR